MHHRSVWGLVTGVTAALALTTPAFAAAGATVSVSLDATTVAIGAETQVYPTFGADKDVVLTGVKIAYKLSDDLAGVSLVNPESGDCTVTSPTELACSVWYEVDLGPDGQTGLLSAGLKAADSAVAGATGELTATFSADGVEPVSSTAKVKVAEGVDLAAGESTEIKVAPGKAFDATLEVTNAGAEPVNGAGLYLYTDYGFETTERYENCAYRADGRVSGCVFDQELEPDATYQVVMPYRLRADTAAPSNTAGEFVWVTADDYADNAASQAAEGLKAKSGSGSTLKLKALASAKRAPQTDPTEDNNWQSLTVNVTGKNGTDVEALGAKASGKAGDEVTVAVGLRNNGPATIDSSRSGEPASVAVVTIPSGTSVTTVPEGCAAVEGKAGKYECYAGFIFVAKTSLTWKFGLRIDKVQADATGTVEANPACQCSRFDRDIKKSNDTAKLIINPTAAPEDEEPAEGGTGGGDGEDGGSLPITGPQGTAIAVTGVLLVAAGVAGFLVARKRRTRFEA